MFNRWIYNHIWHFILITIILVYCEKKLEAITFDW